MLGSGTRLSTYIVTSHLGSGGMGEVYQAHDTKLDRDVAIKQRTAAFMSPEQAHGKDGFFRSRPASRR